MSLFQAREWWRKKLGADEEFAHGCMCVANIDNAPDGQAKVVTGSLHGQLRIHAPRQEEQAQEQLLEQNLEQPILQIEAGRFKPLEPEHLALAVLHPRRLVLFSVVFQPIGVHVLETLFRHDLNAHGGSFTAFNMCCGRFGGSHRDLLCVQSMDGKVQILEHNAHSFTRRLVTCLLPGPLVYVDRIDAFVTCNAACEIECYKFQSLAAAAEPAPAGSSAAAADMESAGAGGRRGIAAGKKIVPEWTRQLGEMAVEIKVARVASTGSDDRSPSGKCDIVVLGERTLFALKENGTIRSQRRLDYHSSTLCSYPRPSASGALSGSENLIIGTYENSLLVFSDATLVWSATVESPPVALAVATFGFQEGLIVTLDETGVLVVNYLGTEPPSAAVTSSEQAEINYQELEDEHRKLLHIIRQSQNERPSNERVELRVSCPRVLDAADASPETMTDAQEMEQDYGALVRHAGGAFVQLTLRIMITFVGQGQLNDVQISLSLPEFVVARETSFPVASLKGGSTTPLVLPVLLHATSARMPTTLNGAATASYAVKGEPRTAEAHFALPLCLACCLIAPQPRHKLSNYKVTLDTNKPPCQLVPLFEDFFAQLSEDEALAAAGPTANSCLCFQHWFLDPNTKEPVDTTILVSKNTGRYRVQSMSLPALHIVTTALVQRLDTYFAAAEGGAAEKVEPLQVQYNDDIPFQDFFQAIDRHFELREHLLQAKSELNDKAHQLRVIQKRLLVRFKDRNPQPLNQLEVLFEQTYSQVMRLTDVVERLQQHLDFASADLSCTVSLVLLLIQLRIGLSDEDATVLAHYLTPLVGDHDSQWEECVDAALTHLLKTSLAKTAKDSAAGPQALAMPPDTTKLKRHIQMVCDRLMKGASLTARPQPQQAESKGGESESKLGQ